MLKKYFLSVLLSLSVVCGIAVKDAFSSNNYLSIDNQSDTIYKEEIVNNFEHAISNNDIKKKEEPNIISQNKKVKDSKDTKIANTTKKVTTSIRESTIKTSSYKQTSEINKVQEVNVPTETPKTTKRVEETTKNITVKTLNYDRTTKIYDDDKETLLRVEYYLNNKLVYYSDIEKYDTKTKSYIEKIYQWNYDKDIESLVRTDVYSKGKLIKSY